MINALVSGPNAPGLDLPGPPVSGSQTQSQPPGAVQGGPHSVQGGSMAPPIWPPPPQQPNQAQMSSQPQPNIPSSQPASRPPGIPASAGPGAPPSGPNGPVPLPMTSHHSGATSADMKKVYDALGLQYPYEGGGNGPPPQQPNTLPTLAGKIIANSLWFYCLEASTLCCVIYVTFTFRWTQNCCHEQQPAQ
jgi:hypothetical protein